MNCWHLLGWTAFSETGQLSQSGDTQIRLEYVWLAYWAGKMNQILRCDWLPERASGITRYAPQEKNYSLYHRWRLLGQDSWIWSEKKENLAKIQPSWPQALHEGHIVIWQVLIMNKPSSRRGTMSCSGLTSISTDFCQRIKRRRELQHWQPLLTSKNGQGQ